MLFSRNQLMEEEDKKYTKTPAIASGEANGFNLVQMKKEDLERVSERISEGHMSGFPCPANPSEDIARIDTEYKKHRVYIVTDSDAGIIGYCSLAISTRIYTAADEKRVKLVYVDSSCSFTTSKRIVNGKTVNDIIGDKRSRGAPRLGRYIKDAIARELCMEYGVDIVIISSFYVKKALPAHLENGARKFDAASIAYLNSLAILSGENVLERLGTDLFFDAEEHSGYGVKMMLLTGGIYVAYPPNSVPRVGGRRRNRITRRKPRTSRKRTMRRRAD
jgi:hypothetical protein